MQCLEDSSGTATIFPPNPVLTTFQLLKFEENQLKQIPNHSDDMSVSCEAIGEVKTPQEFTHEYGAA